ncbi:MAG: hypothetical protein MUC43_11975, partial [Pirellula sp.]|nr:hypothetical protein [Pirellula sp.]
PHTHSLIRSELSGGLGGTALETFSLHGRNGFEGVLDSLANMLYFYQRSGGSLGPLAKMPSRMTNYFSHLFRYGILAHGS